MKFTYETLVFLFCIIDTDKIFCVVTKSNHESHTGIAIQDEGVYCVKTQIQQYNQFWSHFHKHLLTVTFSSLAHRHSLDGNFLFFNHKTLI